MYEPAAPSAPSPAAPKPTSSSYGTVMAVLFALAILYAIAVYVHWSAWLPGLGRS